MFEEYPKWKYKGADGVVVQDADEEKTLGDGYTDAPVAEPVERVKRSYVRRAVKHDDASVAEASEPAERSTDGEESLV